MNSIIRLPEARLRTVPCMSSKDAYHPQLVAGTPSKQSVRQQIPHQSINSNICPNKKPRPRPGLFIQLVPEIGIEPTTYALRMRRSTN